MQYSSVEHAIKEIEDIYGDRVGWNRSVVKSIDKWGQRTDIAGDLVTVWNSPADNENYLDSNGTSADNTIDSLTCTDTNFDGVVNIEGHTKDDSGNLSFVTQNITVDGQNAVSLTTDLCRCTRIRALDETALALADYVSVYDSSQTTISSGVPQTDAGVYATMRGGQYRNTEKAATAIDSDSYFAVEELAVSMGADKTATVEVFFQQRVLGQGFYSTIAPFFIGNTNPTPAAKEKKRSLIVPPNSDFRVLAIRTSGAQAVTVTARISGILLRKISQ